MAKIKRNISEAVGELRAVEGIAEEFSAFVIAASQMMARLDALREFGALTPDQWSQLKNSADKLRELLYA